MEKPHYYFDMPKETYDFIIKKGILKESRKSRTKATVNASITK